MEKELLELEKCIESLGYPAVFSHNDLLLKNIIYNKEEGMVLPFFVISLEKDMHDVRLFKCHIIFIVILYQFDFSMQGKSLSLTKNMACTIINLLILGTISVNMQVRAIKEIRIDTTKVIELKI